MSRARSKVDPASLQRVEQVRRDGERVVKAGPKAIRTRTALIKAASEVFAEQGFQGSSVAQIAERAGVSLGTFYQYFRHRGDVLGAMLGASLEATRDRGPAEWRASTGVAGVEVMLVTYIKAYAATRDTVGIWEMVSHTEPEMAEVRRTISRAIIENIEKELVRASGRGQIRKMTKREAQLTARALAAMVDRFCYDSYVFMPPEKPPTPEEAAKVLATVWAAGIGLEEPQRGG